MDTVVIRQQIEEARRHEASTHELALLLQARLASLHSSISVRAGEPAVQLMSFVTAFIDRTPELLETVIEISRDAPWQEHCEELVEACAAFFSSPPPVLEGRKGLNGIMTRAYLCHRLVEEVNDCYRIFCHRPLLPLDFTTANLIIHHLIGEPLANFLDHLVDQRAAELNGFAGLESPGEAQLREHDELMAVCRRRKLVDDGSDTAIFITGLFPGHTIH